MTPSHIIFIVIPELFEDLVTAFSNMFAWFLQPIGDLVVYVMDFYNFPDVLINIILNAMDLPVFALITSMPFLTFMIGGGLYIYICYQLITWILDIL